MIARRYAKALLEIGIADKQFERYGREVALVAQAFSQSKELQEAVINPIFPPSQRARLIADVANRVAGGEAARPVVNFLKLLVERQRIVALPHIALVLSDLVDERARRVRATITAARPLPPEARATLERAIEARAKKQVQLDVQVDPEQLGGVKVKIGDLLFDGSVRGQLDRMRKQLES